MIDAEDKGRGYWSQVFSEAVALMKKRPNMGGETAFWLARAKVEEANGQPLLELEILK